MPDFTLEPNHTLVVGMTGSGKTTFVNRYLLNVGLTGDDAPPACRFIYDDLNRVWPRLRLRPCYTVADVERALGTRWVCLNHERMFPLANFVPRQGVPTPGHACFRWYCKFISDRSAAGPGRKIVCFPEMWRWCTDDSIPPEFAFLAQSGRELGIELVLDTQRPEKVNPSIVGSLTELICFKLASADALKAVKDMGADRDEVAALPLGSYIAYNRLSGAVLRGRVF